jgi:ornithine decarboxylase/arginine decarboxylase
VHRRDGFRAHEATVAEVMDHVERGRVDLRVPYVIKGIEGNGSIEGVELHHAGEDETVERMFTIGITKGRWNTMLTALQQFKDDYDKNAPLWRILPEFCAAFPRYERMGLADLSQAIHEMYAKGDIARLTTEMYLSDLQPAMKPADAFSRIAHRDTERVDIDALEGRITTSLLTPYPPGIPLLIPGERFNRKIVEYLRFTRSFNAAFPGFETDVHGLVELEDEAGGPRRYYVDCVKD